MTIISDTLQSFFRKFFSVISETFRVHILVIFIKFVTVYT